MTTREELERAVLDAAKAWFQAGERGGLAAVFDPTQQELVRATEALIAAAPVMAYLDREGDVWRRSKVNFNHWCFRRQCAATDGHYGLTTDDIEGMKDELRECEP